MMSPREQYVLSLRSAVVCLLFTIAVSGVLFYDYSQRTSEDPLNMASYAEMRQQLQEDPSNESLQVEFREKDRQLREVYFDSRTFVAWGRWLLLFGIAGAVGLGKWATVLRRRMPDPKLASAEQRATADETDRRFGSIAVGGFAIAASLMAILFFFSIPSELTNRSDPLVKSVSGDSESVVATGPGRESIETVGEPTVAQDNPGEMPAATAEVSKPLPTPEVFQSNWPRFRGPSGRGIVSEADVLTSWNVETGEGICWKSEVPIAGNNSPIVWEDRVFLSGATEEQRTVMCFDAAAGQLLWQKDLPQIDSATGVPSVMEETGFAASTMATDGRAVFAIFANGDLGAFDFEGNLLWSRAMGLPKNTYGHASSLMTYDDLLIVQFDQGTESENLSRLFAFNTLTGETVWETPREEVPNSWPTPIVVQVGDTPQLITAASPNVVAYNPRDGKELWRADCLHGDVGPSPTYADGIVVVANEVPGVTAIKADGQGDVTETHLLWDGYDGVPDLCSPLATESMVLLLTSDGLLTCYDLKEGGDPLWEHELDGSFSSSPTMIGKNVFLIDTDGKVFVVEPSADACSDVTENNLGQPCVTSPAVKDGKMFIRGETHLFCIGSST